MKKIIIPKTCPELPTDIGEGKLELKPYPFSKWTELLIDSTPEFGKGPSILGKVIGLLNVVRDADKHDDVIHLENDDYKLFKKALDASIHTSLARKCYEAGYYSAVENAEDFIPTKPEGGQG